MCCVCRVGESLEYFILLFIISESKTGCSFILIIMVVRMYMSAYQTNAFDEAIKAAQFSGRISALLGGSFFSSSQTHFLPPPPSLIIIAETQSPPPLLEK